MRPLLTSVYRVRVRVTTLPLVVLECVTVTTTLCCLHHGLVLFLFTILFQVEHRAELFLFVCKVSTRISQECLLKLHVHVYWVRSVQGSYG
jgi:hypothetical protein